MREILFRGKSELGNRWVSGCYTKLRNDGGIEHRIVKDYGGFFRIIPETVGQYTDLKDKNGERIFEGDIVKCDDYIFFVKYGKCGGVQNSENYGYMGFYLEAYDEATKRCVNYGLRVDICYFTDIEVIDNIHDNSELLEAAE